MTCSSGEVCGMTGGVSWSASQISGFLRSILFLASMEMY